MLKDEIWQEIEKATGISDLKAKALSEDEQEVKITKTKHFADTDYEVMYQNIFDLGSKEGYTKGFEAGEEKPIKELKREKGWDFEGKKLDSLVDYLEGQLESKPKKVKEEAKTEYQKDIEALRRKLEETESAKNSEIEALSNKYKSSIIDSVIDNHFNAIQIQIPSNIVDEKQQQEYVKMTLDKEKTFFKSQYNFDTNENNQVIAKKGDEIIKDEVQNPLSIDSLVKSHIEKSFIPIKQKRKGRGDGDYTPTHNELANIRTREELDE